MPAQDKVYDRVLANARAKGDAKDYRHCDGWRDSRNAEILRLYVQGKVTVALAIQHGAKPKDHLAAIEAGKVTIEALIAAGVDLHKIENTQKRLDGRASAEKVRAAIAQAKAIPKPLVVVNKANGASKTVLPMVKPKTTRDLQVEIAMLRAAAMDNARKAKAAKGKKGFEISNLSESEKQAIAESHARKGQIILK